MAFVGFGRGGVGFGFGNVGWVPLAPYERFNRWYGRGYSGGRNATFVNNVSVYNSYRNARVGNAVTAVDGAGFARGASGRAFSGDLRQASLVRGGVPVAPSRDSMRFSNRAVATPVSRTSDNQRFFTRQSSPAANRSFSQGARISPAQSTAPSSSQGGWRQFGHPTGSSSSMVQAPRTSAPTTNSGWGRFGEPATRTAPAQTPRSTASAGNTGWQRFEGRPSPSNTPPAQSPRYSGAPAQNPNQGRYTPPANVDRLRTTGARDFRSRLGSALLWCESVRHRRDMNRRARAETATAAGRERRAVGADLATAAEVAVRTVAAVRTAIAAAAIADVLKISSSSLKPGSGSMVSRAIFFLL